MQFSEQVIQIMDKLCEKFGIVLDWSSANVFPYIQELSNRLIKYEVFTSLIWIILSILMISASYLFLIKSTKIYKNNNKYNTFNEELFVLSIVLFMFCSIFGIGIILIQSFDIVQALTIPEKTIIEYLSSYIK
ncbi:hypothetical protein [Clostridium sp. M14]|uniref:hypothetical protein n=1 Tax=Clostridium sp. M14 TaxID=2716311 RepID=UPI0013EE44E5|nr:hypothetical protein [Clostridium sp. M14]MBZ9693214.1 hypothetical protein [Clostridium sp. M14]